MVFKWMAFGKFLEAGIENYDLGIYEQAKREFQSALDINDNDFLVNFWLLRINIKLGNSQESKQFAAKCISLRPDLKEIVMPWQFLIESGIPSKEEWIELETKTDKQITKYQNYRTYSIKDVFKIFGTCLLIIAGIFVFYVICLFYLKIPLSAFSKVDQIPPISMIIPYLLSLPFVLIYYRKPILIMNLWIKIKRITFLFKNKRFLYYLLILVGIKLLIVIFTAIMQVSGLYNYWDMLRGKEYYLNYPSVIIIVVFLAPICEEVIFRGLIFRYINQFNRLLAYTVSIFLFYSFHGGAANFLHILLGIFFAFAYEKFDTLLAPIVLHVFQNIVAIIAIFLHLKLLPMILGVQ